MNHEKIILATLCCMWSRLRVSDPLTKIYQLGFGRVESKGNGKYDCFVAQEDDSLEITAGGSLMKRMSFV